MGIVFTSLKSSIPLYLAALSLKLKRLIVLSSLNQAAKQWCRHIQR
jgi:hypothetical protein